MHAATSPLLVQCSYRDCQCLPACWAMMSLPLCVVIDVHILCK